MTTIPVLAASAGILLALAILFLVLWLVSARRASVQSRARVMAERDRIDLRLSLEEQTARLRIVRELHEVAVHSVSVIINQAEGAQYAGEKDPGAAVRSASVIADSAKTTLADLRRVMTVVREGEAAAALQPRIKSARELFKVMRDAGLVIEYEENGTRFGLAEGAEVAIYRILQESLSNALKHGGDGTEVRVSFTWTADGLQLKIDDDGTRSSLRRAGHDPNQVAQQRAYNVSDDLGALTEVVSGAGITEMRERAALFGGVFHAYSVPGVGFSVAVVFPALRHHNGVHGVALGR